MNALLETFSCVYSESMSNIISFFQKINKRGGGRNKSGGGLENVSKMNKPGGGDDYSVLESIYFLCLYILSFAEGIFRV